MGQNQEVDHNSCVQSQMSLEWLLSYWTDSYDASISEELRSLQCEET